MDGSVGRQLRFSENGDSAAQGEAVPLKVIRVLQNIARRKSPKPPLFAVERQDGRRALPELRRRLAGPVQHRASEPYADHGAILGLAEEHEEDGYVGAQLVGVEADGPVVPADGEPF